VVIDNGGGGIFDFLPQAEQLEREEFEALLGTPRALDWERAAALFEVPHRRVERLSELGDALAAGTCLIEVRTDRAENVDLHRALTEAAVGAVRARLAGE
jgi:2-succinyl-5-enolpyruvyl-6-hydroxy-3-cyclohexene-1-carboxylate synthase